MNAFHRIQISELPTFPGSPFPNRNIDPRNRIQACIECCRYHAYSNIKTWMLYSEDIKAVLKQRKLYLTGLLMNLEALILERSW